jgi:hypothetical protein
MRRTLAAISRAMGVRFHVRGVPESAVVVFAPEGLLPVLALDAQLHAREMLGLDLGVEFQDDEEAALGVSCVVPRLTGDDLSVARACFFLNSAQKILGLQENVDIELSPVIERYCHGLLSAVDTQGEMTKWPLAAVSPR